MAIRLQIDPTTIYDDGAVSLALELSQAALARARRSGTLRFSRPGRRALYLGQWLVDWLESASGANTIGNNFAVKTATTQISNPKGCGR